MAAIFVRVYGKAHGSSGRDRSHPPHEGSDGPMSKDLWNGGSLLMHDRPPVWGYASSASQVRQGLIPCMTSAQRFKSPHDVMEG